jgi:hypothetical protein
MIILAWELLFQIIPAMTVPAKNVCVNNLRQLDGAKQLWELEGRKTTNDIPIMQDLRPYLKNVIKCPQGGLYILGRVGVPPKCTVGGTHVLPD